VYPETAVVGESSAAAYEAGRAWRKAREHTSDTPRDDEEE